MRTASGLVAAILALDLAAPAAAQPALKGPLAGLSFLVGRWRADDGKVADTGQTSVGTSSFTVEADGAALLRRDRTDLTNPDGKRAGGFGQIMLIHAADGGLGAEYVDGEGHVIRYERVALKPGRSVVFTSPSGEGQPAFRLSYELKGPDDLKVDFGMMPPGSANLRLIASGMLHRVK
ncbi:MAG: hypothetical protein JSR98_11530 [Proteobacteria bacterium]|nr:hypothetical protein [Pseudomonadota bacterium]